MNLGSQSPNGRTEPFAHLVCLLVFSPLTFAQAAPSAESPAPEAAAPVRMTLPHVIGPQTPCPYPPEAKWQHKEGVTALRATITTDGAATEISVLQSSGSQTLDEAAVQCFAKWHFAPATRNFVPMTFAMKYSIRWKL